MTRSIAAIAAVLIVAMSSPAAAQSPGMPTVKLSLEQAHTIKEVIKDAGVERLPAGNYAVGDTLPEPITLQPFPSLVTEKVPNVSAHRFFLSGAKIVIVDPKDRKIAEVLE